MVEQPNRRIGERTASAAAWLIGVRLLTKLIDFVALLILARLLTPADFGLVAIAMTLVLVVEAVLEMPTSQALVRQPVITMGQLNTAFTLGILRGITLAALLAVLAYPFSIFYGDWRLVPLLLALGCAPILRGMQSPRLAEFVRQIDFRRDFIIDFTGKAFSFASATSVAWWSHSYWALVCGTVTTPLVMVITSYIVAPMRPRLTLREWSLFADFVGWSTVTQLLSAVSWQSDKLILGHVVGTRAVGAFALANDLAYMPELALIKPVMRPLMAAFAHLGDATDQLRQAYKRASHMLFAIGSPVMLGLCLLADPLVRLLLGGKWLAAVPILQWLPLSLIPPLLSAPFWSLSMALGRPRIFSWQTLIDLMLRAGLCLAGAVIDGVTGVVVARVIASVLSAVAAAWCVRLLTGAAVWRQFLETWRIVAAGSAMATVVSLLRHLTDGRDGLALVGTLTAIIVLGGVVYAGTMIAAWRLSGAPAGIESSCQRYLQGRLRRTRSPSLLYALIDVQQWQRCQASGELVAHRYGGMPLFLMTAADVLTAASRLPSALDRLVLVQVERDTVPGAACRGRVGVTRLPMSAIRRTYPLKNLRDRQTEAELR